MVVLPRAEYNAMRRQLFTLLHHMQGLLRQFSVFQGLIKSKRALTQQNLAYQNSAWPLPNIQGLPVPRRKKRTGPPKQATRQEPPLMRRADPQHGAARPLVVYSKNTEQTPPEGKTTSETATADEDITRERATKAAPVRIAILAQNPKPLPRLHLGISA